jgi:hypothetical protein
LLKISSHGISEAGQVCFTGMFQKDLQILFPLQGSRQVLPTSSFACFLAMDTHQEEFKSCMIREVDWEVVNARNL